MRLPSASILLSFVISTSFKSKNAHLAEAAKLRRGSFKPSDKIDEISSLSADEDSSSSETRSLASLTTLVKSTLDEAEIFAMKKIPPEKLMSSKCGSSMFRKQHPLCFRYKDGEEVIKPPSIPLFSPPTGAPTGSKTLLPPPSIVATTSPTATSSLQSSTTVEPTAPSPTSPPTEQLNCVQTVVGSELTIPIQTFFRKGEVHCLRVDSGLQAYFGYNWSNQFGLFVNGQAVWIAPETSVAASDRWIFQSDGNLLLRDSNNQGIWRTHTCCNRDSRMVVSVTRVWIESRSGSTLWFQPLLPAPSTEPTRRAPTSPPTATAPTPPPTILTHTGLNCVQTVAGDVLTIPAKTRYYQGEVHCLISADGQAAYFGYTWNNEFGLFSNAESLWTVPRGYLDDLDRWDFQEDGNLVLRDSNSNSVWTSATFGNYGAHLRVSFERAFIEKKNGMEVWSTAQPRTTPEDGFPDPNGALQYYAYYYPWYLRNNWSRHGYQDEPLLGKYGTDEVGVAEQHIQWALETGITSWIISWWGANHLAMKHFKAGMINAPSINKIKFCMLYESKILSGRGSWRDGSRQEALYQHLRVIRDEFFDHPSYLRINGRPVIIFYITRSQMMFQEGFDGLSVLANMRRRLGHDIYFIADEPFFNPYNKSPDGNGNAFKNGVQVFDGYTTYNMFVDSKVRRGETATAYQLREGMPVYQRWAEQVPFFPNVMPQYYDFRGHKPLLGNAADFKIQLREVACLPRTNFNGAPHIMFITSFNEWWEGTQIEPEDGSPGNWNNYGFQFMETLAEFKREVDSVGTYWCDEVTTEETNYGTRD